MVPNLDQIFECTWLTFWWEKEKKRKYNVLVILIVIKRKKNTIWSFVSQWFPPSLKTSLNDVTHRSDKKVKRINVLERWLLNSNYPQVLTKSDVKINSHNLLNLHPKILTSPVASTCQSWDVDMGSHFEGLKILWQHHQPLNLKYAWNKGWMDYSSSIYADVIYEWPIHYK